VTTKIRLDQLLVTSCVVDTRTRAQALILAGRVLVDGNRVDKAGTLVARSAEITLKGETLPFVSRGGVKLAGALDAFGVAVAGLRCLDVGASTGGFTDCLLQRGAKIVIAVDVGYGQLAAKLRSDARVVVRERTNARTLTAEDIGGAVDLTVVDASFIGLAKLLPAIALCTRHAGQLVALVKPQFEVGRKEAARAKGVVRDASVRSSAIDRVTTDIGEAGFRILGSRDSTLAGPKGNVEAFVWARREV
jgi:23S rRNA (cytidine1920-2'-O)/16S rRNA (cytidine1409-2'-O)-methyltransferase